MNAIQTPFINIQTDFGFKEVFGREKNKKALLRFLNILFDGKLRITDVTYHDKEILPSEQDGKRIIYDVYCTTPAKKSDSSFFPEVQTSGRDGEKEKDHHFILEMQNIYVHPFEERIVFYASRMISGQGKPGWDYELDPVFAIALTDFNFSHMKPKLVRDVMLVDRDSMEPLTDKLHIMMCSLKEVPEKWEACRTELEEIMFLIKNMDNMDSASTAYREGKYAEVFDAARSNNLRPDDMVEYSKSLDKLRDIQRGIKYEAERASKKAMEEGRAKGIAEGRAKGIAEGRAKGIAEGRAEEKIVIAKNMRSSGINADIIAACTGLSITEILSL
ncbi:MAG: Rpn family recombination-promoting nuclease/putative transposase [Muribaculaceae bacterium]|nr:Rpn family recombination-promoting nuclease/putative transposase [Muribaculaceae bacterium]